MNRGFGIVLAVPIVFLSMLYLMLAQTATTESTRLDEYILSYAVDYATEGAVEELLSMAHLGQDYEETSKTNVDPDLALESFLNILCVSYGFPLNGVAAEEIASFYLPVFCVATYDGYYLYTWEQEQGKYQYLQGSPKMPYSYSADGAYYALTLGEQYSYRLCNGTLLRVDNTEYGITNAMVRQVVNSHISDEITFAFQKATGRDSKFIYLPTDLTTLKKTNPIQGTTVLAFIDGWDYATRKPISTFSVGGAAVDNARVIAGYRKGSVKYYAYTDLVPTSITVIETFSTPTEAAEAGYYCDLELMT